MSRQLVACLALTAAWLPCLAAEPPSGCPPQNCTRRCPDDYCPKPLPKLPCPGKPGCADDYGPKPLPRLPCAATWRGMDDYCRKQFSFCVGPTSQPWYTCGTPAAKAK